MLFKKAEEPKLEAKIDLGLQAYMSKNESKDEAAVKPVIEIVEVPAPTPQVIILEQISTPEEAWLNSISTAELEF